MHSEPSRSTDGLSYQQVAGRSCDECNKRKIKCNRGLPSCETCIEKERKCTYDRPTLQRGIRKGYIKSLEEKLESLENTRLFQNLTTEASTPIASITHLQMANFPYSTSTLNAPGFFSDLNSKKEWIDLFFHYVYPILPIFHVPSFMLNWEKQDPALLCIMFAFGKRFQLAHAGKNDFTEAEQYYHFARRSELLSVAPSVPSCQLAFLLCLYSAISSETEIQSFLIFQGLAVRIGYLLKNEDEDPENNQKQELSLLDMEIRRRLWWYCFISDRETTITKTPIPSQMTGIDILKMKHMASEARFNHVFGNELLMVEEEEMTLGTRLILLYDIVAKIAEFSSREEKLGCPLDSDYAQLQTLLFNWYISQPNELKFCGSLQYPYIPNSVDHSTMIQSLFVYYLGYIILNFQRMVGDVQGNPMGYSESKYLSACLEAAGAISSLCDIVAKANPHFFYISPFYTFSQMSAGLVYGFVLKWNLEPQLVIDSQYKLNLIFQSFMIQGRYYYVSIYWHNLLIKMLDNLKIGY